MSFVLGSLMWLGWAAWNIHAQRRGWVWNGYLERVYRDKQPGMFWITLGLSWAGLIVLLLAAIYAAIPWPPPIT